MNVGQFAEQFGGYWHGECPDYPADDWKTEVRNGDTRLGYWEWVANRLGCTIDTEIGR